MVLCQSRIEWDRTLLPGCMYADKNTSAMADKNILKIWVCTVQFLMLARKAELGKNDLDN